MHSSVFVLSFTELNYTFIYRAEYCMNTEWNTLNAASISIHDTKFKISEHISHNAMEMLIQSQFH